MYKLYYETGGKYTLYGEYPTDQMARMAIVEWCAEHNFKSYYWNMYEVPEGNRLAGGLHIDFGSWSEFFIIYKE